MAPSPSLLTCFGGIDVSVEEGPSRRALMAYGRLHDHQDGKGNNSGMNGDQAVCSSGSSEPRRHQQQHCYSYQQKKPLHEDMEDDDNRGSSMKSNMKRLGVVSAKLKQSSRRVAGKLRRACEQLVEAANKSTPLMVDLFLSNHLLLQLSATPVTSFTRSSSLHLSTAHTAPPHIFTTTPATPTTTTTTRNSPFLSS